MAFGLPLARHKTTPPVVSTMHPHFKSYNVNNYVYSKHLKPKKTTMYIQIYTHTKAKHIVNGYYYLWWEDIVHIYFIINKVADAKGAVTPPISWKVEGHDYDNYEIL